MAFNTYSEGLNNASNLANKAIATEASLSALAPLASPLPTLLRAFQLYVSAAEAYSHLIQSGLVAPHDKPTVQRKWKLVLERAEKVKRRVEELGGRVSNPEVADELEESAVLRRSSRINNVSAEAWRAAPPDREFSSSAPFVDPAQPDLASEQLVLDPEWAELPRGAWDVSPSGHWEVRQGPGADCSVTAGLGACLSHNEKWGTKLCQDVLYPQTVSGEPRRSENAKHVVKLLLNGVWRQVVVDALLPKAKTSLTPLHITARSTSTATGVGPAWLPIAVKGYFKALGGYSIPGSDPAPDVYAFTGWIPERLELRSGFQREKVWTRLITAFREGSVIVTLGSGKEVAPGLVPLHAYGVTDFQEEKEDTEGGEVCHRTLQIFDPGSPCMGSSGQLDSLTDGLHNVSLGERAGRVPQCFTMTWDEVCSKFATLNLNWNPELMPTSVERHWSWAKPQQLEGDTAEWLSLRTSPKFRIEATAAHEGDELWLLLSQHVQDKSIPMDDVALHVFREYQQQEQPSSAPVIPESSFTPYTNALHTLVKYPLRQGPNVVNAIASRDRGIFQTGFTLRAYGSKGVSSLSLSRIGHTLPFKETVELALTKRSAGGNPAFPTHHQNPQFRLGVDSAAGAKPGSKSKLHFLLSGTKDVPWNVKLVWGKGERVYDLSHEMILASSGAYSFGMAYCEVDGVASGSYTVVVSAYERDQVGSFKLQVESSSPITMSPILQEGAGMYNRKVVGRWDAATSGGRPSGHGYARNPRIEVTVPVQASLQARLLLPDPAPIPVNLTLFKRGTGSETKDMVATSGPYVERVSGVAISRVKVSPGVYVLVPSTYETGVQCEWSLDLWADASFSVEP